MDEIVLRAENIHKSYRLDKIVVPVLKGVDLKIKRGEFLSILGASGSGKSTLLHILGSLDTPDQGSVYFEGRDIFATDEVGRSELRNKSFGFVFQFYHLFAEFTVLENVMIGSMISTGVGSWLKRRRDLEEKAYRLLERLGLADRAMHFPAELSGGERQRLAIARAIFNSPCILFADEPTGNLDERTGSEIFDILLELNGSGQTIVMVTHNIALADKTDRVVYLKDGRIFEADI